jgi:hypothetical protein
MLPLLALAAALALAGCSGWTHPSPAKAADPPLLGLWNRIGDIALDEPRTRVEQEYGTRRDRLVSR